MNDLELQRGLPRESAFYFYFTYALSRVSLILRLKHIFWLSIIKKYII